MKDNTVMKDDPNKPECAETEQAQAELTPEQEIARLEESLKAQEDSYLRLRAEYDNFRKRSQKEREGLYAMAQSEVLSAFLPVLDNMDRACAAEDAGDGARMIQKQMIGVLERYNVAALGEPGEAFDPNLHNAVMHDGEGGNGESVVSEVLQKGYKMGERLLRPAMVKTRD